MSSVRTNAQRAALMKLIDGKWHSLNGIGLKAFAVESMVRDRLIELDIVVQPSTPGRDYGYRLRLTDAGRIELGAAL